MAKNVMNECVPEKGDLYNWAQATDCNDHTGAILGAVRWAKRCAKYGEGLYGFIESALTKIKAKHQKHGFMPMELVNERNVLSQAFFAAVREEFGEDTFKMIHKCF